MELLQLQYFQTVARLENLTKASQELYITQPNLSVSIARLEESIGVPLFFHRKGQIKLTEYGKIFLEYVDNAFMELESGMTKIHEMYELSQKQISVATSINDLLPDLLKSFSQKNPYVHIRQFNFSLKQIIEHLINHNVAFAITSEQITHPKIDWLPFVETEKMLLFNNNHPFASKTRISIYDLSKERFICDTSRADETFIESIGRKAGFIPHIVCESNDNKLAVDLLEANFGILFVSASALMRIQALFPSAQVKAARLKDSPENAVIGIARLKNYQFSEISHKFFSYVTNYLSQINLDTQQFLLKHYSE
ncbi:MAG: yybE [Firmicutes bacterium]|nr:yybE [Bacillota bacterium]